ncbi:MAG: hypothetical protein RIQ89_2283 [Bacteroidota bacterium]|jgi:nicotinamide riboside kinase
MEETSITSKIVVQNMPLTIAIIGAESTGKSYLAKALATHYQGIAIPEYARHFTQHYGTQVTTNDIIHCYHTQEDELQLQIQKRPSIILMDTEWIMAKIWNDDINGSRNAYFEKKIASQTFDFYLLCNNDVAFEEDPLRVNEHRREYFFNSYLDALVQSNQNYKIISGKGEARLLMAKNYCDDFFNQ